MQDTRSYSPLLYILCGAVALAMTVHVLYEPPALNYTVYMDTSLPIETRVDALLANMTLDEKIGQMALIEKNSISPEAVRVYNIGAILSGAGGKPENNTPAGWRDMIEQYIDASRKSRLGIPILYGVDANHGHGNVPGATIFPHVIGLGATHDAELVEKIAHASAKESLATGARWNFSPSLDVPTDIRWGRVYENFSDDPLLVGELGSAYIRGLQADTPVLATVKHYIGAGGMLWQSSSNENFSIDQGVTPPEEKILRAFYLPPFLSAVQNGALSIMVGLNTWGETKVSASHYLINDVLKHDLGFKGFVVSDWFGVYEISSNTYIASVTAINAGVDMVMLPFDYKQFTLDVKKAVYRGDISQDRIDDAVRRILRAKFTLGLFDSEPEIELAVIGSEEHRSLAREAVRKSLVILKNDDVLSLSPSQKIRVAGSAADNIGRQAGAWTFEWQGIDGNWLPGATSILTGIREAVPNSIVQYDKDGIFAEKDIADVGIAIVGEKPYAEGWGDNPNPTLSAEDIATITRLRDSVRKLVVVIITGRPLIITDELQNWDALIVAWLPGSEGAGVADVLFGKATSTGVLPITWPRNIEQLPIDLFGFTSDGTAPLFPRGFGLSN